MICNVCNKRIAYIRMTKEDIITNVCYDCFTGKVMYELDVYGGQIDKIPMNNNKFNIEVNK